MHLQNASRLFWTALCFEECLKRIDQIARMCGVVLDQTGQRFVVERAQLGQLFSGEDQAIDAELVEVRESADSVQPATHRQRLLRFVVRLLDAGKARSDAARADGDANRAVGSS